MENEKERGAGEEWVTKIDGWSDTEHQGERYSVLRQRKMRGAAENLERIKRQKKSAGGYRSTRIK